MCRIQFPLIAAVPRFIGLWILLLAGGSGWCAEVLQKLEIQETYGAKIYEEVRILGQTDVGIKIAHKAGLAVVPYAKLPPELAQKYKAAAKPEAPAPSTLPKQPVGPADPPSNSPTAGKQQLTAAGVNMSCFVIIKTDKGSGSGFVATVNGKTYVYTNAHVICGEVGSFTSRLTSIATATGQKIPVPYEIELSESVDPNASNGLEDVARFAVVLKDVEGLQVSSPDSDELSLGKNVIAYGNSLGGDVITELPGSILGASNDRCEVSCEFVPGNSGGPVVFQESKKVIGIATYVSDSGKRNRWAKDSRFERIRRFAVRPAKVTKWRKIPYTALLTSLEELNKFDRDTLSLEAACALNPKANRGGFDIPSEQRGDYNIRDVIVSGSKLSLGSAIVGGISRVNDRLGRLSGTVAMSTVVPVFQEFFTNVIKVSNTQSAALLASDRAPYLKQYFPEMVKERAAVLEEFNKQAARFR